MTERARFSSFVGAAALLLATGCAPTLYDWGSYEAGLRSQLVDHDSDRARAEIESTLVALRKTEPRRTPPGLHAEYGFLLYLRGDSAGAVENFRRESELFPESRYLMERLIRRVGERRDEASARLGDASR